MPLIVSPVPERLDLRWFDESARLFSMETIFLKILGKRLENNVSLWREAPGHASLVQVM
jgi:hypothetical protein